MKREYKIVITYVPPDDPVSIMFFRQLKCVRFEISRDSRFHIINSSFTSIKFSVAGTKTIFENPLHSTEEIYSYIMAPITKPALVCCIAVDPIRCAYHKPKMD